MTTQTNTAQNPGTLTHDQTGRIIKLNAMLAISYGSLILDLAEAHNAPCVPGDLQRLAHDAKALADYSDRLLGGLSHE